MAAGGVVGVLGHHRRDRQQGGRGDRHPLLHAQLAHGRRPGPAVEPSEPTGTASPHRRPRHTRTSTLHPAAPAFVRERAHDMRCGCDSGAQGRRPRTARSMRSRVEEVTICALIARHIWNARQACATVRAVHQDSPFGEMGTGTRNRATNSVRTSRRGPAQAGPSSFRVDSVPAIQMSRVGPARRPASLGAYGHIASGNSSLDL
jgi:hypothetical protein